MYGLYLTAKVRAKRDHDGVEAVYLNPEGWDALRGDDRHVRDSTPETAPVRFGMAGDFTVEQCTDYQSYVLAEDGTEIRFYGEEVEA